MRADRDIFSTSIRSQLSETEAKARNAENQVEHMQRDIERLLMITAALWKLLQQANGFTDQQLKDLISEIDLRDGLLDGRMTKKETRPCPNCKRPCSTALMKCMYCGQVLQVEPFAR